MAKASKSNCPPEVVKMLSTVPQSAADSAQLLAAITDAWGGSITLARDVHKEFQQAKAGSMVRQRIIEMIARLTVQVTSQDLAKPKDKEDMTLEELEAEAAAIMARGLNGGTAAPNGQEPAWPKLPEGA